MGCTIVKLSSAAARVDPCGEPQVLLHSGGDDGNDDGDDGEGHSHLMSISHEGQVGGRDPATRWQASLVDILAKQLQVARYGG